MNIPRVGPACLQFEGVIWVAGGLTKSKRQPLTKEVECYDPSKNTWTKSQPLKTPRCFSCLHTISNRLFIIGGAGETTSEDGNNNVESIGSIDVWDAKECTWQNQANISIARHGHTVSSIG
ncbi:hypothetical protein QAD02_015803 [Eretmocerus hayati]|uniref:Uncharacterized protein n=1 Tax=Eretmocerus hayati TaxID=131215 RepID=A0ACC2P994_9HYME|nr:hypothetical protein QAD02_015803 [Eretmocerus hayati]